MTDAQLGLENLPTKDGFRLRGSEMTRIETFTDAAFAFALTLLVVALDLPGNYAELVEALKGVPAFAFSAALLMLFWWGHHEWSRRYGLDDGPTVMLSCLLVFTVLIYVYPLRFLSRGLTTWLSYLFGLPVTGSFELGPHEVNHLFVIYGLGFAAMCAAILLLNLHAWRLRDELRLSELERFDTRVEMRVWMIVGSSGVLSILLALFTRPSLLGIPGWAYWMLAIVMPLHGTYVRRRRAELVADTSA